jgi:hypothetical protein
MCITPMLVQERINKGIKVMSGEVPHVEFKWPSLAIVTSYNSRM